MEIPAQWHGYDCDDYFCSALAENGYWDELGEYWYIWPAAQVHEDATNQFLIVGSAGVDGINWGYRKGEKGLWAWYPILGEWRWLAQTVDSLLQGWLSGAITV